MFWVKWLFFKCINDLAIQYERETEPHSLDILFSLSSSWALQEPQHFFLLLFPCVRKLTQLAAGKKKSNDSWKCKMLGAAVNLEFKVVTGHFIRHMFRAQKKAAMVTNEWRSAGNKMRGSLKMILSLRQQNAPTVHRPAPDVSTHGRAHACSNFDSTCNYVFPTFLNSEEAAVQLKCQKKTSIKTVNYTDRHFKKIKCLFVSSSNKWTLFRFLFWFASYKAHPVKPLYYIFYIIFVNMESCVVFAYLSSTK